MAEIVWTRGAEADLQAAYEVEEKYGVGEEFLRLIDAAVELLKQFPEMAPIYQRPFRRLLIKDGKHGLFYTIENRGIILHAVADLRRDPEELRRRFRNLR